MLRKSKRLASLSGALLLLFMLTVSLIPPRQVFATQIGARSLTLQPGASDPGSMPGGVVNHFFDFVVPNVGTPNIGSIKIQYCTTAADVGAQTCVKPNGLLTSTVTGVDDAGSDVTGFSLQTSPAPPEGTVIITRTAAQVALNSEIKFQLQGVTNPDATDASCAIPTDTDASSCTFYARLSTYTSTDATTGLVDTGTVAAVVNGAIVLNGTMPESLVFCTGGTIGVSSNVPDCATATTGAVDFDRLFSPQDTAQATSQMAASTNAGSGYNITVNGLTMTSGVNTISAIGTADYSRKGTSQFGMNLVENTDFCGSGCNLGADVTQTGGSLYNGEALAGYNTGGDNSTVVGTGAQFQFNNGDSVADSKVGNGSPATGASDAQIYTVSYVVNVPGSQPAGTYTTTLTYICTATY